MEEVYRLPLGTQSFETLRSDGERYVDKTHYVERLLLFGRFIFLSRPRRFGKSLFLSTLKAYFEGQKALFKGLYIEQDEEDMARRQGRTAWEEHPVFYINLRRGRRRCSPLTNGNVHSWVSWRTWTVFIFHYLCTAKS